jgi:outer membrane immunogenic protein
MGTRLRARVFPVCWSTAACRRLVYGTAANEHYQQSTPNTVCVISPQSQTLSKEDEMKKFLIASLLLASASTTAMAADLYQPPEPAPAAEETYVAPSTWDGGYLGIMGGYGWLDADFNGAGNPDHHNFGGGQLGGFAGWNMQFDNAIVVGIEGDVQYNWNEENFRGANLRTDWAGAVRGRLGYAMDNVLIYGAAGWTATNANMNFGAGPNRDRTFNGYTVGAGVDYKMTDSMFARVEYRFNNFGDRNIGGTNVNMDQHAITVGLGFKF